MTLDSELTPERNVFFCEITRKNRLYKRPNVSQTVSAEISVCSAKNSMIELSKMSCGEIFSMCACWALRQSYVTALRYTVTLGLGTCDAKLRDKSRKGTFFRTL